jgi:SulP family sulfate permease
MARNLVPDAVAGALSGVLCLLFSVSVAALVFKGFPTGDLAAGTTATLIGAALASGIVTARSSLATAVGTAQDDPAAVLGLAVGAIAGAVDHPFPTAIACCAVSTLMTGGVFYMLSRLRLGYLVRFIPYPVAAGFVAGTSWLLFLGGFSVLAGHDISAGALLSVFRDVAPALWLPAVAFALLITVLTRRISHYLLLPGCSSASSSCSSRPCGSPASPWPRPRGSVSCRTSPTSAWSGRPQHFTVVFPRTAQL